MFVFSKNVLIHILEKIKSELDNKSDSTYKVNGKTYNKVLSEVEYNEFYDEILTNLDIEDNSLLSIHDILHTFDYDENKSVAAADLGRQIREYYLNDTMHRYTTKDQLNNRIIQSDELFFITDSEELYALNTDQMHQLRDTYCNTLINKDFVYAKLDEIDNCLINYENKTFASLSDRLLYIDNFIDNIEKSADEFEDIIDCYGVRINFEMNDYIRTHKAKHLLKPEDFDGIMPWAGIKRCTVNNGVVTSYCGDQNFKEDGSMGDVMVEIPKFYYKVIPIELEPAQNGGQQIVEAEWLISNKKSDDFNVHPAFIRNGVEIDYIYVGAYEGVLFDTSANSYVEGYNLVPYANEDKLGSVKGYIPFNGNNFSYSTARSLINNNNSKYTTLDFLTISAIQLLYLIEYANFDSQDVIGTGIYKEEVIQTNPLLSTGETFELENSSGYVEEGHVSYRGIENLWGNAWDTVGGLIVDPANQDVYWSDKCDYVLNRNTQHKLSFKMSTTDGFISKVGYDSNNDFCFIPTETQGASNTGLCDIYYHKDSSSDTSICSYGGCIGLTNHCGLFAMNMNLDATTRGVQTLVTRIQFYK